MMAMQLWLSDGGWLVVSAEDWVKVKVRLAYADPSKEFVAIPDSDGTLWKVRVGAITRFREVDE